MNNNDNVTLPNRWTLIRDVAVFQVKVIFDGFRDLLLVPISLVSGLISLISGGSEFYDLLRLGRRSERWINLFGAAERVHGPATDTERFNARDIDDMASRVEAFIISEYKRGGVTAQAKERLDTAIDSMVRLRKRRSEAETNGDHVS